ncbi:MAG: hypothetical protein RL039_1322 [Pseudomonadota bacterium]
MNTPRPLFFRALTALDTERHAQLRLPAERKHFGFAAQATLLPLTVAEVGPALRHYPIVLVAEGQQLALVAMTGLGDSGNRFVQPSGEWRAGTYIPAYVRGYPFIAVRPSADAEPVLAFDPQAQDFAQAQGQTQGQRLIGADGQPSEQLKGILAFHAEYRQLAERTQAMAQALREAGVLEEGGLQLQGAAGTAPQKIGGFWVVSESRLKALSGPALQKLMDADALGLAYAQLFSMGSLPQLFAAPAGAPPESTAPTAANPAKASAKRSKKTAQ